MRKIILPTLVLMLTTGQLLLAASSVRIESRSGDVQIRRGVEETWHPASSGTVLEEIDSILTGEGGQVELELSDGATFRLGPNSILDIADLRKLTEQELFLVLMSRKVRNMERREQKTKLRIGKVNVVHGELKTGNITGQSSGVSLLWRMEKNGALALYGQGYTTNSILKLNNILAKYPDLEDCGEIQFHLGKALEDLDKPGQALDAYKATVQKRCDERTPWANEAETAIKRLTH